MSDAEDLRFPIGRFMPPAANTPAVRQSQIETLQQLPHNLRQAVAGLADAQLDTPYREGGWTVRQLVHHIADSHANSYIRFKLALTEDWPTIKPYDEKAWAELADNSMSIDVSLTLIEAMHARWAILLHGMNEDDFHKGYNHPVNGRQSLATALALYAWHSRHHTAHITNLRARQGW